MVTVDGYISEFPHEVQHSLNRIRKIILENVPEAIESISYGIPAYKFHGKPLIYYAAYAKHIGLYATPAGHEAFSKELSIYKQGKGSVQFPIKQELPFDLIEKIVLFNKNTILTKVK